MAKMKTLDGERTSIADLNTGSDIAEQSSGQPVTRLQRWLKNLNMVMAGMYTGLNCYGTPKTHHEFEDKSESSKTKPDRRLI